MIKKRNGLIFYFLINFVNGQVTEKKIILILLDLLKTLLPWHRGRVKMLLKDYAIKWKCYKSQSRCWI